VQDRDSGSEETPRPDRFWSIKYTEKKLLLTSREISPSKGTLVTAGRFSLLCSRRCLT
jgi:hypothetical protein